MANQTTADAVKQFKEFVKQHPELVQTVRSGDKSWKDIFEEWVLFGEDHEVWKEYGLKEKDERKEQSAKTGESLQQFLNFISNIDAENLNDHLEKINGALTNIQDIISQLSPKRSYQFIGRRPPHLRHPSFRQTPSHKRD